MLYIPKTDNYLEILNDFSEYFISAREVLYSKLRKEQN